jgi:hypothetical protein
VFTLVTGTGGQRNFALVNKAIKENLSFFTVVGPKEYGLHSGVWGQIFTVVCVGVFGGGMVFTGGDTGGNGDGLVSQVVTWRGAWGTVVDDKVCNFNISCNLLKIISIL